MSNENRRLINETTWIRARTHAMTAIRFVGIVMLLIGVWNLVAGHYGGEAILPFYRSLIPGQLSAQNVRLDVMADFAVSMFGAAVAYFL
jgi:uncharacterized membrane protein YiaA